MADHGNNYKRMTGEEGEEIGSLSPQCGHHCGTITVGGKDTHTGHCSCPECHDNVRMGDQIAVMPGRDFAEPPAVVRVSGRGRVPHVQ